MSKKKDARQVKIRNILMEKGQYRVKDLAAILHVTPETLRKDLDELEEQGIVVRSHGFARVNKFRQELPISVRNQENTDIKKTPDLSSYRRNSRWKYRLFRCREYFASRN